MDKKVWIWGIVEAIIWYITIFYFLSVLRDPEADLWLASLILLVLAYLGVLACPWFRETGAWKKLWTPKAVNSPVAPAPAPSPETKQ